MTWVGALFPAVVLLTAGAFQAAKECASLDIGLTYEPLAALLCLLAILHESGNI